MYKDKKTVRAIVQNIGYLTQLGFSIAFPPVFCAFGALWLQRKTGAGSWLVLLGVIVGLLSGISCFVNFCRQMTRRSQRKG